MAATQRWALIVLVLSIAPPNHGCGRACDTMWYAYHARVVDFLGEPVVDAEVEVRVKKTNERTGCGYQEEYYLKRGLYCVIDDGSPGIEDDNTRIKVRAYKEGFLSGWSEHVFRHGRCHPVHVSGSEEPLVLLPVAEGHGAG